LSVLVIAQSGFPVNRVVEVLLVVGIINTV
jgi:hypothetical protein